MSATVKAEIQGLEDTQNKLKQVTDDLSKGAFVSAMREAADLVTRDAQILAPVDTGELRASITPDVRMDGNMIVGVVGTVKTYGPYMEMGTGTPAGNAPHYPPPDALEIWAARHGFANGMQVARIIWRRGGLMPRNYLQQAFDDNADEVQAILDRAVQDIVNE